MKLKLVKFDTLFGVNRCYEILECSNPFLVGRHIWHQVANNETYISFAGAKKNDYETNWNDFKTRFKINGEIEITEHKFTNQK